MGKSGCDKRSRGESQQYDNGLAKRKTTEQNKEDCVRGRDLIRKFTVPKVVMTFPAFMEPGLKLPVSIRPYPVPL